MWGQEQQEAFELDGHVALRGAVDRDATAHMAEAMWRFVESRTEIDRADPSTWPSGWSGVSLKKLKRHSSFHAAVEAPATRAALDSIFGADEWEASRSGAQVLFSFPDTGTDDWHVPSDLWHMDSTFHRRVVPPRAVKVFTVVEQLAPRGGATMVLAGTPNLQAEHAATVDADQRLGNRTTWTRFLRDSDPWLARFAEGTGDDRDAALAVARSVGGHRIELRELCGEPGDVHLAHINLFHSVSANAGDRPRMVVTHLVHPRREP